MNKITNEEFIEKSKNIWGGFYDYSLVNYINNKIPIKLICPEHGIFEQTPNNHLTKKHKCPKCSVKFVDKEKFISNSIKIHGDKYDYSNIKYEGSYTKIDIICKIHGIFEQMPHSHLYGSGCPECSSINRRLPIYNFIERSNNIHNNYYDYSFVEYINNRTKVKIICKEHGIFDQTPMKHLYGNGCPTCKESKGERQIRKLLELNNITYKYQHSFCGCNNINSLIFDFYLPELRICLEYNGEQHYRCIEYFGGVDNFKKQIVRDHIKKQFCLENNITLIEIRYDEDINEKLEHLYEKA